MEVSFGDWFGDAANYVFAVIALVMLFSAFRVVTSRNVVHAVLFLVATLAGSAALFLLLGAEFVAWTVVLVYIGAVVVLFLFGIMITRAPMGREVELDHPRKWPAALVAVAVFGTLAYALVVGYENVAVDTNIGRTGDLDQSLFDRVVIPVEVVSVLLLAALIGGIVLARRDPVVPDEEPA